MMTERELFEQLIPQIAEIIVEARKLSKEQYNKWKQEVLDEVNVNGKPSGFIKKVFIVIESHLKEGVTA